MKPSSPIPTFLVLAAPIVFILMVSFEVLNQLGGSPAEILRADRGGDGLIESIDDTIDELETAGYDMILGNDLEVDQESYELALGILRDNARTDAAQREIDEVEAAIEQVRVPLESMVFAGLERASSIQRTEVAPQAEVARASLVPLRERHRTMIAGESTKSASQAAAAQRVIVGAVLVALVLCFLVSRSRERAEWQAASAERRLGSSTA